jgi:chromosomal replication initiation ATPase DnaA
MLEPVASDTWPRVAFSLWHGLMRVPTTLGSIAAEVAERHGLSVDDLRGPSPARRFAWPRQEAMAISRACTDKSLPVIGRFYHRDHATVIAAIRRHAERTAA